MKIKCRLCGEVVEIEKNDDLPAISDAMAKHLDHHQWEMLDYLRGKRGNGAIMRHIHSLAFEPNSLAMNDATVPWTQDDSDFRIAKMKFASAACEPEALRPPEGKKI